MSAFPLLGARALSGWVLSPTLLPEGVFSPLSPCDKREAAHSFCESIWWGSSRLAWSDTHTHTHGGSPMAVLIQMYMPIRPLNQYTRGRD